MVNRLIALFVLACCSGCGGESSSFWEGLWEVRRIVSFEQPAELSFRSGGEAVPVAVTASASSGCRPFLRVFWGEGVDFAVEFDVGAGVETAFYTSNLRVLASAGVGSGDFAVRLTPGVGAAGDGSLFRTAYFDDFSPGSSGAASIPAFASVLRFVQQSPLDGAVLVEFLDEAGNPGYVNAVGHSELFRSAVGDAELPVPVAGDAAQVRVTNIGTAVTSARLVFELGL